MSLWSCAATDSSSWADICEKNLSTTDLGHRGDICPPVCIWVGMVTFRHTDREGWRRGTVAEKSRKGGEGVEGKVCSG